MSTQDLGSNGTEASMTCGSLESVADKQVLYLTTVGRRTGLPREIEIWFVVWCERLYLFAETREAAGWVKNIRRDPKVKVRIGEWRIDATARVLDPHTDRKLWDQVGAIADRKYGWGDGLPVEITPLPSRAPRPADETSKELKERAIPGRLERQKAQQADATVRDGRDCKGWKRRSLSNHCIGVLVYLKEGVFEWNALKAGLSW